MRVCDSVSPLCCVHFISVLPNDNLNVASLRVFVVTINGATLGSCFVYVAVVVGVVIVAIVTTKFMLKYFFCWLLNWFFGPFY